MNGFCKDYTAKWLFPPFFSTVLQIEGYAVCGRGDPGAAFSSANAGAWELARDPQAWDAVVGMEAG